MALEQVFECPSTLAKLRSAPLGKLLDDFCKWLLDHGFTPGTTALIVTLPTAGIAFIATTTEGRRA